MIFTKYVQGMLRPMSLAALVVAAGVAGCMSFGSGDAKNAELASSAKIQALDLNNLVTPAVRSTPVALSAAKNEWATFQLQVSGLVPAEKVAYTLRLQPLNLKTANRSIAAQHLSVYQILPMPVDVNRAGYVRHTGLSAESKMLPRALLPMTVTDGKVNLSAARDPNQPTNPQARAGAAPVMLWVDLHVPPETPAGSYAGACDVMMTGVDKPIASVPVNLTVYDFVMSDERHLNLVGELEWSSFSRLYTERFEAITPKFLNRSDPRYAPAVKTIDQLMVLAQAHRVQVVVPRLAPTVKWPVAGRPPLVTWEDFDSVVAPWLKGEMFADKVKLGYWPLPECDGLAEYETQAQRLYWTEAATHFDQNEWLAQSPVFLEKPDGGRANTIDAVKYSGEAASILAAHSRIRVAVPLEDDQLQMANVSNPALISPSDTPRLITANPGLVFTSPIQSWPSGVARPSRWMRTDLTGLIPYVGAGGDERDVRIWAWLSSLPLPPPPLGGMQYGPVQFVRFGGALPLNSNPTEPADPNELIWFYPGSWFGIDQPIPTIQLKWLRRAQQDYEYLYLARQRRATLQAMGISRLMTKPVQVQAFQQPDQTFGLMSGTSDPKAWDDALTLLARSILLREPGQQPDAAKEAALDTQILQWGQPQERPVIMGRWAGWGWELQNRQPRIALRLGIDIYNPSDSTPDQNMLVWSNIPAGSGWQVNPAPIPIPALQTYHVRRYSMDATVDPSRLRGANRRPVQVTFTNGFNNQATPLHLVLPVAATDLRQPGMRFDGFLNDWSGDDAIQDGPLVKFYNRPALQSQQLQMAAKPAQIFTAWAEPDFYVAFKVSGVSSSMPSMVRNFADYSFRRAWGEDLCEILVQAVYADNSLGPVLHIVCKPTGGLWIERKSDDRSLADPWQAFDSTGLRYIRTLENGDWRSEVAIPWTAINGPDRKSPVMLRFNFTHHVQQTGESASWAGPVDFGRDDLFMGLLVLRETERPGLVTPARN